MAGEFGLRAGSKKWRPALFGRNSYQRKNHLQSLELIRGFSANVAVAEAPDLMENEHVLVFPEFSPAPISFSNLLSQFSVTKSIKEGLQIHAHLIKLHLSQDPKHRNHLINFYSKCRIFGDARKLIRESKEPDLVSWSSLISGYAQNGQGEDALLAFHEMHLLGIKCNEFTFPCVLKSCTITKKFMLGRQVHANIVITGFESDVFVANTLVILYAKCGHFEDSKKLFEDIPVKNVVSWNALFSCYTQNESFREAVGLFQEMIVSRCQPDEFSLSTILNPYREENSWISD